MTSTRRAVAVLATALLASACGSAANEPGEPRETLTVGVAYDQPGLSVMGRDGQPTGFEADIARYLAASLGVPADRIIWRDAGADNRETLITDGAADIIVSTYSITAQRKQRVSFAGPYLVTGQDLLVRTDNRDITGPESLNGKTVCATAGSLPASTVSQFAPKVKLVEKSTHSACVGALTEGDIDAVTSDDVILAGYAAHKAGLRVLNRPYTRERYGVGVRKGDAVLQRELNDAIAQMISDGSWLESERRHLSGSGHHLNAPTPVFTTPDESVTDVADAEPELADTVTALAETSNAGDWQRFNTMVCPRTQDAIGTLIRQSSPRYDTRFGPEVRTATTVNRVTGITQSGPNSGRFLAHEAFAVPPRYRQYYKDVDYTGTMIKDDTGTWKLCDISADFVE